MNRYLLACCLTLLCAMQAWAEGTITHLSGAISVLKKDGTTIPGTVGTKVGEGDVMITGADGFGRLELTDGGEMVLRPNSQLKIENYRFHADKPSEDSFAYRMLKGGLRTVTGLIGKRGNPNAYVGTTSTATIGIRGTQFDLRLCQGDCGSLADGTYLAVRFGGVRTGNAAGSLDVAAGQVALVQTAKIPVMLPRDPGIGFTPPAVIPKLDEKKKVQAAAQAAAPAPAQAKPAAAASTTQAAPAAKASAPAAAGASSSTSSTSSSASSSTSSPSGSTSTQSSAAPVAAPAAETTPATTPAAAAAPVQQTATQQAPAQQAPVQQAPAQQAPAPVSAPSADTAPAPAQPTPVQQAPAQAPVSAAPAVETAPAAATAPVQQVPTVAAAAAPTAAVSITPAPVAVPTPPAAAGMECSVQ